MEIYYKKIMNYSTNLWMVELHGWGVNSSYMECFTRIQKYNHLLIDLPGFGLSKLDCKYTIETYVDELNKLLDELKIDEFYGLGHSFGGKILMFYALNYPSKVKKLFLIAPSIANNQTIKSKTKILIYKWLKKNKRKIPKKYRGSVDYQNSSSYLRDTFICVCHRYLTANDLRKIDCITTIFAFKNDKEINLRNLKKSSKLLKNGTIYVLEGNHFSYFTNLSFIKRKLVQ